MVRKTKYYDEECSFCADRAVAVIYGEAAKTCGFCGNEVRMCAPHLEEMICKITDLGDRLK